MRPTPRGRRQKPGRLEIVVTGLDFARLRRQQFDLSTGFFQRLTRLVELYFFHTIGREDGNLPALQFV
jgi:hypothetical protein